MASWPVMTSLTLMSIDVRLYACNTLKMAEWIVMKFVTDVMLFVANTKSFFLISCEM